MFKEKPFSKLSMTSVIFTALSIMVLLSRDICPGPLRFHYWSLYFLIQPQSNCANQEATLLILSTQPELIFVISIVRLIKGKSYHQINLYQSSFSKEFIAPGMYSLQDVLCRNEMCIREFFFFFLITKSNCTSGV